MYKLLLCLRYLRTRYIALASIISVTLGVATMIVVNSVMAGFSTEMRERIHGLLADVVIETNSLDGVPDAEEHLALVRQAAGDYIESMTTTVEVYGMLSFQYHGQWITRPVTLIGIDPGEKAKVGPLKDFLQSYRPTIVDGRMTEPAQRSMDVPPGWTLTESAQEYRQWWIERQQMMIHGLGEEDDSLPTPLVPGESVTPPFKGEDPGPPIFDEFPNSNASTDEPGAAQQDDSAVAAPTPADSEPSTPLIADESGPTFAPPQFEPPPFEAEGAPELPDSAGWVGLLDGRLYVGMGLISFPYEDDKGKVQTLMMVKPGDDVKLSTVTSGRPPDTTHFNATVVDVFKSGMSEYDSNLVFCNLEYLQKVRGMVDPSTGVRSITSIQIKLKDETDAKVVVERLQAVFPPGRYSVKTWEQKQGPLLAAVDIESAILNVLLFLIIAVAGFGILAIFYMIVVEKTRDIGILKALGAGSGGIMSIFLSYGLALGIVGSGVGVGIGILFVHYINEIEGFITWITGHKVFDERIYYFPEIPTSINASMVIWVAVGAMTIAVLASILPARRAARLRPVEALRFE
ncbi:MAG: FtsX-like permease family protein [Planctomycetaceae bacterium]|jgi:lipoprotein-releasing system permease protein|nr:FtsX-like permease family protein [Planctomycetaceae bacterium]MBT6155056.1 FtsX-like permease family protein [Planctomycetaceae bacterium]MBT6486129.1 FtsX-like permease family protein [Planctomycetaceae bacterium]MBT6495240.1 FtsX-like permease family protein [Planctomycetaceae bacterium]